jgi:hypothetical protein
VSINYQFSSWGVPSALDFKIDDTDPNYTYLGYANPGSDPAAAGWMILRISKADSGNSNLNTGRWADGQSWMLRPGDNLHAWNNRATYGYEA